MLEGIVQGVVVQMTAYKGFSMLALILFKTSFFEFSQTSNLTYIEVDVWSAYSTYASASAVSQLAHQ